MAFVRTRSIQTRDIGSSNVLARAVGDAYAVDGFEPELAFDFTGETYRTDGSATTFSGAMTHAATSLGTMVDGYGAIKWRPHNLLTYSEDFTNAAWAKTNTTITASSINSPDGDANGSLADATTTGNGVSTTATIVADSTNTCSFYVKYSSAQWIRIVLYEAATSTNRVTLWADVLNGVLGSVTSGGTGSGQTGNIENVGNGWYRISLSGAVNNSATSVVVQISNASSDGVTTGTTDDYYVYGAHLYRSDLGGMVDNPDRGDSYVPTTSAAVYLPRRGHYVYNDQAWTNRGLLLESEARTNLLTYSEDFTDASWLTGGLNSVVSSDTSTSPDGNANAETLSVDSVGGTTGTVGVAVAITVSTSTAYTASVFAKADQSDFLALGVVSMTTPANGNVWFDLVNGTVGTSDTGLSGTIQDFGNGWYRCSITFTTDAADTSGQLRIYLDNADGGSTITRDGTSSILIYGAQLEAGSVPSSYIPTNGATSTRAAETLTVAAADLPSTITPIVRRAALVTAGWTITDGGAV